MKQRHRFGAAVGAIWLVLALLAGPALATEGGGEERQKWQPASSVYELVGLGILGVFALAGGLAVLNARKQLRGERDQATGEFRWR